jgi:hypothetical protein
MRLLPTAAPGQRYRLPKRQVYIETWNEAHRAQEIIQGEGLQQWLRSAAVWPACPNPAHALWRTFGRLDGWHMMISGDEFLDEVYAVVRVERPILEYTEELVKAGVPHHIIAVRGQVRQELEQLARLLD